jgi:predicted secreted protein
MYQKIKFFGLILFGSISLCSNAQIGVGTAKIYGGSQMTNSIDNCLNNIIAHQNSDSRIEISVKTLANLKPDYYKAIFEVSQSGKSSQEVNDHLANRVEKALRNCHSVKDLQTHIDMISLVPKYAFAAEKKLFSKDLFFEIPNGFELKKNLHLQFSDSKDLNKIINAMAEVGIYNLIKITAHSNILTETKARLIKEAHAVYRTKYANYKLIKGEEINNYKKNISDGLMIYSPLDNYISYQASSNRVLKGSYLTSKVKSMEKSQTTYFNEIPNENFDFVLNSDYLIPPIQMVYQMNIILYKPNKKSKETPKNNYFVVGQNGNIQKLNIQ